MKHDNELIERVARAMYDRSVLRGADRDIPMMYHDLAQAALDAAFEWQPISTAPRDGSHILVFWGRPVVAFYEKGEWYHVPEYGRTGTYRHVGGWPPQHWLPLPPAPEE